MKDDMLCRTIPVIDGSNILRTQRTSTLVPALQSKWTKLLGPKNPFIDHYYIDLGVVYSKSGVFAGKYTPEEKLLQFLVKHSGAIDLEKLWPPNMALQVASSELTCEQAFLLLEWIRSARARSSDFPKKFVNSISVGKWLKTFSGFNSPNQSILPDATVKVIFDMMKSFMKDFAIVDQEFYRNKIYKYEDELKFLGVSSGLNDVQKLVLDRCKSYAVSGMSKDCAFSLLMFLGYLKISNMLDQKWLSDIKEGKWLMTSQGYSSPMVSILLPSEIEAQLVLTLTKLPVIDEGFYGSKIASFSSELALLGVTSDVEEVYKLIADNIFSDLSFSNGDSGLLILKCIRYSGSASNALVEKIRNQPWLKTCSGAKCSMECILPDPGWRCLLSGIGVSIIDETFYGDEIRCFKAELEAIGVVVELDRAVKMIGVQLKLLASSPFAPSNVISILSFIRLLNDTLPSYACELCHHLSEEDWLKTRHGYRTPSESILFNSKWGTISLLVDLPLIDDSFYGLSIYGYKAELKLMSVVTDFEGGAAYVARGLNQAIDSSLVTAECTISLLECIRLLSASNDQHLLDDFVCNLKRSKWLKTSHGYRTPEECILLDAAWDEILYHTDAPTLDQRFYEIDISLYKKELRVIGVKVDYEDVCSFLSGLLLTLTETITIKRIYSFLCKFHWKPKLADTCNFRAWIPDYAGGGKWVNSQLCILHDKYNLFDTQFYALDKFYPEELLAIFSSAFGVAEFPSIDNYLQLWHSWVSRSNHQVTLLECSAFWSYVIDNWNPQTQEVLRSLCQVPATACSGEEIFLVRKEEVFIPDDFRMAEVFSSGHEIPLLAWLPKSTTSPFVSRRKLSDIYFTLGVKKISDSVNCSTSFVSLDCHSRFGQRNKLIGKGLIKIILCFLGSLESHMAADKRQKAVKSILDLSVYESVNPIQISYSLPTERMLVEVKMDQLVSWQKMQKHLLICRSGYENRRTNIEFGASFAQEIAAGLLASERSHLIESLGSIIQMAFMFDFSEDAVDFLLRRANLGLYKEDEEFLSTEFPFPLQIIPPNFLLPAPSTPSPSRKKRRI